MKKVFISFAFSLPLFFLTIMLIRLMNGKGAFISVSDLVSWVEGVDVFKPFKEFLNNFKSTFMNFANGALKFASIHDWNSFWSFFGDFAKNLFLIITLPVQAIYYIGYFLVRIILIILDFLDVICGMNPSSWVVS